MKQKKLMAIVLTAALAAAQTVIAFADEPVRINPGTTPGGTASLGDVTVTGQDLPTGGQGVTAVDVSTDGTVSFTVDAGNISMSSNGQHMFVQGVAVANDRMSGENASVEVSVGDISAKDIEGSSASVNGLSVNSWSSEDTTVSTGNISASNGDFAEGLYAINDGYENPGTVSVTVNGNVTADASEGEGSGYAGGVRADAHGNDKLSVTVTGNIEAVGSKQAVGIVTGDFVSGGGSIEIGGNVTATGGNEAEGIVYNNGSNMDITIAGDLTAVNSGSSGKAEAIVVNTNGDGYSQTADAKGGTIEIDGLTTGDIRLTNTSELVDDLGTTNYGTVSVDRLPTIILHEWTGSAIAKDKKEDQTQLNADYSPTVTLTDDASLKAALESKIFYTVNLIQPTSAADGKLEVTTGSLVKDSKGNLAFNAGASVNVNIVAGAGKAVKSVNGGKAVLTKNDDGSYTLVIPEGGGVGISAVIEAIGNGGGIIDMSESSGEGSGGTGGSSGNSVSAYAGGSSVLNQSVTVNGQSGMMSTVTSKDGTQTSFVTFANGDGTRTEMSSTATPGGSIGIEVVSGRVAGAAGSTVAVTATLNTVDAEGNTVAGESTTVNVSAEGNAAVTAGASVVASALDKANAAAEAAGEAAQGSLQAALDNIRNAPAQAPAGFSPVGTLFHADGQPGPGAAAPESIQVNISIPGATQIMVTIIPIDGSAPYNIAVPADGNISIPHDAFYTVSSR